MKRRLLPVFPMLLPAVAWVVVAAMAGAQVDRSRDAPPDTRLVQINLLAARKSGTSELADLPANTRKAIEDIKGFLPFKSYRLLDTSLVRAAISSPERPTRSASTFMTGPDGSKLQVLLRMTTGANASELFVTQFEVNPSMLERFRPVLTPEQPQAGPEAPPTPAIAPRADLLDLGALISTSFTAEVGKTVVVGSSRLNGGDEALIVLFTALP